MSLGAVEDAAERSPAAAGRAPRSIVPLADGLAGLAGLVPAWLLVVVLRPPSLLATWLVLLSTAIPMLLRELRRSAAAPAGQRPATQPLYWLAGFVVATLPFMLVHMQSYGLWLWLLAWTIGTPIIMLRVAIEVRRDGASLLGGFPALLGRVMLGRDGRDWRELAAPARLWALKAFFIPLYVVSLLSLLRDAMADPLHGLFDWLMLAVLFAYAIDLAFAACGYLFASNELVPTIRSTQTRRLGWIVCLLCYAPAFSHWPAFGTVVIDEVNWPRLVGANAGQICAAVAMLVLLALYVSATVVFGLRFSNLTNRGVVSTGPYRLMKHPAYFAHVGNAWIITFGLLPASGVSPSLPQMLVPVAFTALYGLRAITEEQHMGEDPAYVAYAAWVARHGLLARLIRLADRPAR